MNEWWEGLSTLLKVLYCIALPSTLLLLIQTLLSMIGMHDGGTGVDISDTSGLDFDSSAIHGGFDVHSDFTAADMGAHSIIDHDITGHHQVMDGGNPGDFSSMRMFTLQTIVAFLTVFSWTSIVCVQSKMPTALAIGVGFVLGLLVMLAVAKIVQLSARLVENGTLDMRNCLGEVGTVYVPIPPKGSGSGKIMMTVQGQLRELTAVTSSNELIPTGTQVRVTDLSGDTVTVESE